MSLILTLNSFALLTLLIKNPKLFNLFRLDVDLLIFHVFSRNVHKLQIQIDHGFHSGLFSMSFLATRRTFWRTEWSFLVTCPLHLGGGLFRRANSKRVSASSCTAATRGIFPRSRRNWSRTSPFRCLSPITCTRCFYSSSPPVLNRWTATMSNSMANRDQINEACIGHERRTWPYMGT